ncbi:MAG: SDR family oxidoreductase [Acidithiobacillus sp.]
MAKLLITGATGMLGDYVTQSLSAETYILDIALRESLDLNDPSGCYDYIKKRQPQIILHMGAETDVDLCEKNAQAAATRNALSTQAIARAARDCNAYLIYISTSNIFSACDRILFNELDIPSPCNYYGKSKFFGEQSIVAFGPENFLIIRAGWMIGGGRLKDHKFVGKIISAIDSGATEIKAVNDRIGSVTYAKTLADFIRWTLSAKPCGIVHYASLGAISRYEIAVEIAKIMNFSGKVLPVSSSIFPLPAPRPISDAIESIYLPLMVGAPLPGMWRDDLDTYVRTFINASTC